MNYSIIMPVFNREDLTKNCLATLLPTLEGAGDGEVIVVDNGSRPETAAVLAQFPWVRVLRNEENRGFAAACNQAARVATGRYVVHLNNDTVALAGWLARLLARFEDPDVGIAGARLLYPDDTIQHSGVMLMPFRLGPEGFVAFHCLSKFPGNSPAALSPRDFEAVTGACLVTPRELYMELGGFDEIFWNGYEDVDYCLKVRSRGLRVVYEPAAVLYHYESQSGVQRKRRLMHNIRELAARWGTRVAPDHNRYADLTGELRREYAVSGRRGFLRAPLPSVTVIVHGPVSPDPDGFAKKLSGGHMRPQKIIWAAAGRAPVHTTAASDALDVVISETESRADRYVAFVSTRVALAVNWLPELVDTVEFAQDVAAATVLAPSDESEWSPLTADAQCTLVKMAAVPQHVRVDRSLPTVDGAIADWLARAIRLGRSVRRSHRPTASVAIAESDPVYEARYKAPITATIRPDPLRMEALSRPIVPEATFASIVMLSWNAPEFTETAVASIERHTKLPYEIILIDNGSTAETVVRLQALTGVRIIYNETNMGFAHGCNQGMAAALGSHVVLLNNDVVVSDGWLDALLQAHRQDGTVGVSAPCSNYVAGHQQVHDANYADMESMQVFAAKRRDRLRGRTYHTDRVIGFCMCISRAVIEEIGGIDTRYGVGNFEDDDYCVRVRAAGYEIVVCEDSFIHHFGNVTFRANNVDWTSQMQKNWAVFARRWQLPAAYPTNGYNAREAIRRGFERQRDYVPLPNVRADTEPEGAAKLTLQRSSYGLAILALVRNESDWSRLAPVVTNYARAVATETSAVLAIGAMGEVDAATIGKRIERALLKAGLDAERCADIDVGDVEHVDAWRERFAGARCFAFAACTELDGLEPLADRSRSGLARLISGFVLS